MWSFNKSSSLNLVATSAALFCLSFSSLAQAKLPAQELIGECEATNWQVVKEYNGGKNKFYFHVEHKENQKTIEFIYDPSNLSFACDLGNGVMEEAKTKPSRYNSTQGKYLYFDAYCDSLQKRHLEIFVDQKTHAIAAVADKREFETIVTPHTLSNPSGVIKPYLVCIKKDADKAALMSVKSDGKSEILRWTEAETNSSSGVSNAQEVKSSTETASIPAALPGLGNSVVQPYSLLLP